MNYDTLVYGVVRSEIGPTLEDGVAIYGKDTSVNLYNIELNLNGNNSVGVYLDNTDFYHYNVQIVFYSGHDNSSFLCMNRYNFIINLYIGYKKPQVTM